MPQHARPFLSVPNTEDLTFLKDLIEAGKLKPVIDRGYPLSETREAMRYLEEEHAQGKVVVHIRVLVTDQLACLTSACITDQRIASATDAQEVRRRIGCSPH